MDSIEGENISLEEQKLFQRLSDFSPTQSFSDEPKRQEEIIGKTYNSESWQKEKFDIVNTLKHLNGILLEVGGPTPQFDMVDLKKLQDDLQKPIYISNIAPGAPRYDDTSERNITGYYSTVDFQSDAQNLSLKRDSVAAFFASNLPTDIRPQVLHEASRVLNNKGLLIWQGTTEEDLHTMQNLGFEIVQYLRNDYFDRDVILDLILQK